METTFKNGLHTLIGTKEEIKEIMNVTEDEDFHNILNAMVKIGGNYTEDNGTYTLTQAMDM